MESILFLRGFAVGFAMSIPIGPISVLCIRRALASGGLAAFIATLGASVADGIFGTIASYGSSVVGTFFQHEQVPLRIIGGLFLMFMGARSARQPVPLDPDPGASGLVRGFMSVFALTLFNPGNVVGVMAVFAAVGIYASGAASIGTLVAGISTGSALWWLLLSTAAGAVRQHFSPRWLVWLNHGSAAALALFGLITLGTGLLYYFHLTPPALHLFK